MSVPLKNLLLLFIVLLLGGFAFTLPLYQFDLKRLIKSKLFIKILFWIPIFIAFLLTLYASDSIRLVILLCLILAAFIEWRLVALKSKNLKLLTIFVMLFSVGMLHFVFLEDKYASQFIDLLILIGFSTVLSDVAAFFLGSYRGVHKLPEWLNSNKSWEGIIGQLVGAFIGVLLVNICLWHSVSLWTFVPIGLGSMLGDLANSFVKRKENIKDWSHAIPAHGGFIDRFSSMAGSVTLLFYFLWVTGLN